MTENNVANTYPFPPPLSVSTSENNMNFQDTLGRSISHASVGQPRDKSTSSRASGVTLSLAMDYCDKVAMENNGSWAEQIDIELNNLKTQDS